MLYVNIGRYQISIILFIAVFASLSVVVATTYYLWATQVIQLTVDEPLTILECPSELNIHPGENKTLEIKIQNSASVNYSIKLVFTLNNATYQDSFVEFSDYTYTLSPGVNIVKAWMAVSKKASPARLELKIDFYRE